MWLLAVHVNPDKVPIVVDEKILAAAGKLLENKTPGLDDIPNIVLNVAARIAPDIFDLVFTSFLRDGGFPEQ